MRIGIMLRTFDEKGGIGVYSHNLVCELLRIDRANQYVLFYRSPEHLGSYAELDNVTERWVRGWNKATWDQVAIPYACWRERVDVVLHPKFTVPLLAPCKAVMVVHGADWFIPEQARFYSRWDTRYIKTVMPLYLRKASVVLSVSQLTTDAYSQLFQLPTGKIRTVYFGPARHFKRVEDLAQVQAVKARYSLPDRFILTLSKHAGGDRKNIGNVIQGYQVYHSKVESPHKLVVGGKDCDRFRADYGVPDHGYGSDILFPGWIDQADLPAVFSGADVYLYPSRLEAFPIPVTEAMACGTPVITSNVNGLEEIAGDAALMVNPEDVDGIADAVLRVLADPDLRDSLSAKGLARSRCFSWEKCARETLQVLESLAA